MGAIILNLVGLVLNIAAAILMFYFPPRGRPYDGEGRPLMLIAASVDPEKARLGQWQIRLSKVGPLLLFTGFLLQLAAAVCLTWH